MAKGYMGKILWVDLTNRKVEEQAVEEDHYKKFLGGYGLGAKVIWDRQKGSNIDALGPDNILGFTPGLLTGTNALFSGRYMVMGKSPLTGGWGDANSGGYLSIEIKKCGYDGIFFSGISEDPVYLSVRDGKAELKSAQAHWGTDAIAVEDAIRAELGDAKAKVAAIGGAGEKLSLISGIVNDRGRIAARSGLGAVMGSKRLKAIALNGSGKIDIADEKRILALNKEYLVKFNKTQKLERYLSGKLLPRVGRLLGISPVQTRMDAFLWRELVRKFGTGGITAMSSESGDSPVKNWGGVGFRDFPLGTHSSRISGDRVLDFEKKKYNCQACPLGCGGIVDYKDERYDIRDGHKPEYETTCALGTLCLNNDLGSLFYLNEECNKAGIDTISTGSVAAFAIECYENGILTKVDTDGLELTWGNTEAIVGLVEKVIAREGIGDLLADGVKVAAQKIGSGSERFAIHAGGQEVAMHDSRFDPGFGLSYQAEPTPGRHTIASHTYIELMEMDRISPEAQKVAAVFKKLRSQDYTAKVPLQVIQSNYVQACNSLGMCIFGLQTGPIPVFEYSNAATGWHLSNTEYLEIGERIENIRQAYNVREGIKPADMKLAERAVGRPPLTEGPNKGITLDIEKMVAVFYREHDWDVETGRPSKARLEALGLKEVAAVLYG